jgi:hypothetical protein
MNFKFEYQLQVYYVLAVSIATLTACEILSFRIANGGPFDPSGHCDVKSSSKINGSHILHILCDFNKDYGDAKW